MEEYKLTLGMEPTDDYKKAKQDLIQAMRSIQKLSPQQQQMLAEELGYKGFYEQFIAALIDKKKKKIERVLDLQ